ncbi:MAG: hypothetical protein IJD48_04760 [Clostridia bacterium]|nr:hypothetical protein [Clostridia bacterium]
MADYVKIFCENCGSPIDADISQEYVKCNGCGTVLSNPKYLKQNNQATFESSASVGHQESVGGLKGFFKKLGKAFSVGVNHNGNSFHYSHSEGNGVGNHHHHHDPFDHHHHHNNDSFGRRDPFEPSYYAVIKKNAFSYTGECPGIAFTKALMCKTYEECLSEIEKKLGERVGSFNTKYDQPDPRSLNLDEDEKIVRVIPRR